jgi:hypothetical protein
VRDWAPDGGTLESVERVPMNREGNCFLLVGIGGFLGCMLSTIVMGNDGIHWQAGPAVLQALGAPASPSAGPSMFNASVEMASALGRPDQYGRLSRAGREYLTRLARLEPAHDGAAFLQATEKEVRGLLTSQLQHIGPMVFFTRHPLTRPNTAACMIWQSQPTAWGCSIRRFDPAQPAETMHTIFEDPDGCIFDMGLSHDASRVVFSYRNRTDACWQIHEVGVDGRGWRKISRRSDCSDISPVELPSGDLLFVSTRSGGHLVSESGPRSNLYVMSQDGSNVRCVSQNTLADLSPCLLPDGRVLFTRWEYVDRDTENRMGLWTQRPNGRHFQLFFGNTVRRVGIFWQARPVPGHDDLLIATFAAPNGYPYGAIGFVHNRLGLETQLNRGFTSLAGDMAAVGDPATHTDGMDYADMDDGRLLDLARRDATLQSRSEFTDLSIARNLEARAGARLDVSRSVFRDPYPVSDYLFVASYGNYAAGDFSLQLLDLCGNRVQCIAIPGVGCYQPLGLRPYQSAKTPMGSTSLSEETTRWGQALVYDVYRGMPGVARGRAKFIQVMEQVPKSREVSRRAYDQSPIIGYGTYYAKRCWGRVPIAADGSAFFKVPALKEVYLQVLDEHGRELQRQTSSLQVMPGETRSCIGCHEPRNQAPSPTALPLAARRLPHPLRPPSWTDDGWIDFESLVWPVLDRYCGECHTGARAAGGCDLSNDKTRFFDMAYDTLLGRSDSYRQHNLTTGDMLSQEAARGAPLIHFLWLRRAPTGHNRPLQTGSSVSRIDDYLSREHCTQTIPWEDRQRIYTWIDANVPYYATYDVSRPNSAGGRDLFAEKDTGRSAAWYSKQFLGVYNRRCAHCHGEYPDPNDHDKIWSGHYAWINLTHPSWSPALVAHLSEDAGGRGLSTDRFGLTGPLFQDTTDPDYQRMLAAIRVGRQKMFAAPRVDMRRGTEHKE